MDGLAPTTNGMGITNTIMSYERPHLPVHNCGA